MLPLLLECCPGPDLSVMTKLHKEVAPEQMTGISMTWFLTNIFLNSIYPETSCISISQ